MKIEKMYTLKEIETATGISYGTLRMCREEGRLKANKIAGKWRVPETALQEFLKGTEQTHDK